MIDLIYPFAKELYVVKLASHNYTVILIDRDGEKEVLIKCPQVLYYGRTFQGPETIEHFCSPWGDPIKHINVIKTDEGFLVRPVFKDAFSVTVSPNKIVTITDGLAFSIQKRRGA